MSVFEYLASNYFFTGAFIRSVLSWTKALYFQHVLFSSGSTARIKSSITFRKIPMLLIPY